jgi:DNA polymerase-4
MLPRIAFLNLAPMPILFERSAHPELKGRPFVVVGAVGNRGLVVAASPEAVGAGVRTGFTPDAARMMVPGMRIIEERPAAYFEAAAAAQDVCERFIPMTEAQRQDAFLLNLTGTDRLYPDAIGLLRTLQSAISDEVHISSRIGLGTSRLVARLASTCTHEKGILAVPHGEEAEFLGDYPVTVLPGVGVRIADRLKWMGVHTVRELARVPVQTLEAAFGLRGRDISRAAEGYDPYPYRCNPRPKPIKREVTLEQLFYDRRAIRAAIGRLIASVGIELRGAGMQTRSISLEIRHPDTPPTLRRKRIPPADLDSVLSPVVKAFFESVFVRRVRLRSLALSYGDLIHRDDQMHFEFARTKTCDCQENLEKAIDTIRKRYGIESIVPASWRST